MGDRKTQRVWLARVGTTHVMFREVGDRYIATSRHDGFVLAVPAEHVHAYATSVAINQHHREILRRGQTATVDRLAREWGKTRHYVSRLRAQLVDVGALLPSGIVVDDHPLTRAILESEDKQ